MVKKLLGTATTDSNGVATLSYIGVGKGKMQVIAQHSDIESSVVEVLDCIFYDEALDNTKASSYTVPSAVTVSYDNGRKLSKQASGSTANKYYLSTGLTGDWEATVEITSDGNARVGVRDSDGAISVTNQTFTNDTVRIKMQNATLTISKLTDGEWSNLTLPTNNADLTKTLYFTIYMYNTSTELNVTFKNLRVYPI